MGEHSEVYVAFDTAKRKHAVAIAEGGRAGEIRFVGEIENRPATIELLDASIRGAPLAALADRARRPATLRR